MVKLTKVDDVDFNVLQREMKKMAEDSDDRAMKELSNWIFLEFMLRDQINSQAKKLLSPTDYRHRFMFQKESKVTFADAKRTMGNFLKTKGKPTFTTIDKTTDALVMYGLELTLASE